jgi:hypothetical protein
LQRPLFVGLQLQTAQLVASTVDAVAGSPGILAREDLGLDVDAGVAQRRLVALERRPNPRRVAVVARCDVVIDLLEGQRLARFEEQRQQVRHPLEGVGHAPPSVPMVTRRLR